MRRKRTGWLALLRGLLLPVIAAGALVCFAAALNSLDSGRDAESLRQLEEALRRGCVACYAAEGTYPPSLEHLQDRYGVQIDAARYTVYYNIFADNLMPDITVLENET